jgi:hypothetical protein
MKIDKDALIKHRFWILAGLSVPFAAVAILLLVTSVSSGIAKTRKTLEDALKVVKNVSNPQPEAEILARKEAAEILLKKETAVWGAAFKEQEVFFRWPREMEQEFHFADGMFANGVQVLKMPDDKDKAQWPKNKDDLIHGILTAKTDSEFSVETFDPDKKKSVPVRFFVTPNLLKKDAVVDKEGEGGGGALLFQDLQGKIGKFLAVSCQKGRYFADRLTAGEQIKYKKTYHSQIRPILRQVDPLHIDIAADGKPIVAGVVQLRSPTGWTFNPKDEDVDEISSVKEKRDVLIPPENSKFLRFLWKDWDISSDVSEEAWIAQEDLWIQSEIYRVIRAANDSVSDFKNITGKVTKEGEQVDFQNPYFDISFRVKDAKSFDVRIANRLNRRQRIDGMQLRVKFVDDTKVAPQLVSITGDLLEARGDPGKKDVFQKTLPFPKNKVGQYKHVYGLAQVLTWDMAAVKRIDHIAIGSLAPDDIAFSQRTFPMGLQALVKVEKKDDGDKDKPGAQPGPGPGSMNRMGPGKGSQPKQGAALANGFLPDRYQEVTPQFRRVPVAIALIVDQNHVDRVQTAFNNSKLRILVTQVLLNHYPQSLKPRLPTDKAGEGEKQGGQQAPPAFGQMGMGKNGAAANQGGVRAPAASVDDLEANMELVIYGVVTLYERYPARAGQETPPDVAKAP